MGLIKALQLRNVRNVLRNHWLGAFIGGVTGYLSYQIYKGNPTYSTFAITPFEKLFPLANNLPSERSVIIIALIVTLGAFIGAFIQAKGRY